MITNRQVLCLSRALLVLVLPLSILAYSGSAAYGVALNPLDFTSLGAWPGGDVTIDTTNLTATGVLDTAVVHSQTTASEIAVFTFDGSASVNGSITVTGSRPAAILFHGPATISGTISANSAGSRSQQSGPGAGVAADASHGGSGGSFGGAGGDSGLGTGNVYGNLLQELEVGSGGGEGWTLGSWPGGAGGGGIEIGAVGLLDLVGVSISANGSNGTNSGGNGGGGGSGGAIFVHALSVSLDADASLHALGGNGGNGFNFSGSGGGGGRIVVLTNNNGVFTESGASISADGGLAGSANQSGGQPGMAGSINTSATNPIVGLGPIVVDPQGVGATDVIQDPTVAATLLANPLTNPLDLGLDDLAVGNTATGELLASHGGIVSNRDGIVGNSSGATGSITVTGSGSTWNNSRSLLLGILGSGILTIENGGSVNNDDGFLSSNAGAVGIATVRGVESTWTNREALWIGVRGSSGELHVNDGATVTSKDGIIGYNIGSSGVAVVNGSGSFWDVSQSLLVGVSGSGALTVEDQGRVASHNGFIGANPSSSGIATVRGPDSEWAMTGNLVIADAGQGTLNVEDGGKAAIANQLKLNTNAIVNITSGALRFGDIDAADGSLNFASGIVHDTNSLNLAADDGLDGLRHLTDGKTLRVDGTLTLNAPVELKRGVLQVGSLINVPNLIWDRGTLELLGGNTTEDIDIPFQSLLTGTGIISGRVTAVATSSIIATGPLSLGSSTDSNGFYANGDLDVNDQTVTLVDANDAVLDSGAFVDLGTAGTGTLVSSNGLSLDFGGNIVGYGTIDTPNDSTTPLINNGHVAGNSMAEPVTLTGYVKGVGSCDNCNITGTDAPGFSTATVNRGSIKYNGTLEIEIASGENYDRIHHVLSSGVADLGGTLDVQLTSGFTPSAGDTFEIITAIEVRDTFGSVALPSLAGNLQWILDYDIDAVSLAVTVAGDFSGDGVIDAADYTVWADSFGATGHGSAGDGNGDGVVNELDYDVWQTNYGLNTPLATAGLPTSVPEPTSIQLLVLLVASGETPLSFSPRFVVSEQIRPHCSVTDAVPI